MKLDAAFSDPMTTKQAQEFLCLAGFYCAVDGSMGPATRFALRRFQTEAMGLENATGALDKATAVALSSRIREVQGIVEHVAALGITSVGEAAVRMMEILRSLGAREVGGNNRGPWVRLFSGGKEGDGVQWCAWVSAESVLLWAIAAANLARSAAGMEPVDPDLAGLASAWCPSIETAARKLGRFVSAADAAAHPGDIRRGMMFLVQRGGRSAHVGWTSAVDPQNPGAFETAEGNAADQELGGPDRVVRRFRNFKTTPIGFVDVD